MEVIEAATIKIFRSIPAAVEFTKIFLAKENYKSKNIKYVSRKYAAAFFAICSILFISYTSFLLFNSIYYSSKSLTKIASDNIIEIIISVISIIVVIYSYDEIANMKRNR
jgi:Na+/alanine symporter